MKTLRDQRRMLRSNQAKETKKNVDKFFQSLLLPNEFEEYSELIRKSKSQYRQDVIVAILFDRKLNGIFCEVGATNGVNLSNSHLLETSFGWNGLCSEPSRSWFNDFKKNRPKTILDTRAFYQYSGMQLEFSECAFPELSGLTAHSTNDSFQQIRQRSNKKYIVETVTLDEAFMEIFDSSFLDFLSIDTEGSELEVLKGAQEVLSRTSLVLIEFSGDLERLSGYDAYLGSYDFSRIDWPFGGWDAWYVKNSLKNTISSKSPWFDSLSRCLN